MKYKNIKMPVYKIITERDFNLLNDLLEPDELIYSFTPLDEAVKIMKEELKKTKDKKSILVKMINKYEIK